MTLKEYIDKVKKKIRKLEKKLLCTTTQIQIDTLNNVLKNLIKINKLQEEQYNWDDEKPRPEYLSHR